MSKIRTALLALTLALTVAGGAGVASHADADSPTGSAITKTSTVRGGDGWCC